MQKIIQRTVFLISLCFLPTLASSHHSFNATFDASKLNELEGEIVELSWRNPHITFKMAVKADGEQTIWEIETHSVSILRRMEGIEQSMFEVGKKIRVAGHPSRRAGKQLFVLNVLFDDGREVVLQPGSPPRFSGQAISSGGAWLSSQNQAVANDDGLFQTWATSFSGGMLMPTKQELPLTETAKSAVLNFDPFTDSPTLNCNPKGMPTIMGQPYPIRFEDHGNTILLHIEEYDTLRTIHMNQSETDSLIGEQSILGVSLGQWEENSLVVRTDNTNWKYFDDVGVPLSLNARMVERFTPTNDGSRLEYSITVTDSSTFTEPVELTKFWLAIPGIEVQPYECKI